MGIFSLFKQKGIVAGEVVLRGVPQHEMYSVSLGLFRVSSAESPVLTDSTTPAGEWTDNQSVKESQEPDDKPLRFRFERPAGFYYLAISAIVYMRRNGKMFAQVERFFPMTQPCSITAGTVPEIRLEAVWPDIPLEELGSYGVFRPGQPPQLF
jgi:hypothetical protein